MVMCFFHLTWVYMLLAAQVFQVRAVQALIINLSCAVIGADDLPGDDHQ